MIYIDDDQQLSKDDTVYGFLSKAQQAPFVIPAFQRPYSWEIDNVEKLFEDIWTFSQEEGGFVDPKKRYFVGAFVGYYQENGPDGKVLNIVDGQQRVTTLFLLLRLIYDYLEDQNSETAQEYRRLIRRVIWKIKDERKREYDFSCPLLTSNVINEKDAEVFRSILVTGETADRAKDRYSINYEYLRKLLEEKLTTGTFDIQGFYEAILNQTFFLPVIASNVETALRVFDTLNNGGMPLTDADVFKALLYRKAYKKEAQSEFIENWQNLEKTAAEAGLTIQNLFSYHMFYLKGIDGVSKTGNSSIRSFYLNKLKNRLNETNLLPQLKEIANLFKYIKKHNPIEGQDWTANFEIQKILDILRYYPNDYWKYPVICFYLSNKEKVDFEEEFLSFIKRLLSVIVQRYLLKPYVSDIKSFTMNINAAACKGKVREFEWCNYLPKPREVEEAIALPHYKLFPLLLRIVAYADEEQNTILPNGLEIEHILPKDWKGIESEPMETIVANLEHLGNKMLLEKVPNIKASNQWFKLKKAEYAKSELASARAMATLPIDSWTTNQIIERDSRLKSLLMKFFDDCFYEPEVNDNETLTIDISKLSPEQLTTLKAQLAALK